MPPRQPVTPETTLVILLGASAWPHADFEGGPSFANSAHDLRDYFLDSNGFVLPEANLLDLFDLPDSPSDMLIKVGDFLEHRMGQGRFRDLFLYYVGHGSFQDPGQEYFLAIKATRRRRERVTSIRVKDLATEIRSNARHMRRFVLLDCCYAGTASSIFQSSQNQLAAKKTREAFRKGTLVFCSSNKDAASIAPASHRHTMFSGSLLRALQDGRPDLPTHLAMADVDLLVRQHIEKTFDENYAVRPELHSPDQRDGDLRDLPLFPNRAITPNPIRGDVVAWPGQLMIASSEAGTLFINGQKMAELAPNIRFKTKPIPAGDYQIMVTYPDKPPVQETLHISPGKIVEKVLRPQAKALPETQPELEPEPPVSRNLDLAPAKKSPWPMFRITAYVLSAILLAAILYWASTHLGSRNSKSSSKAIVGEVRVFKGGGLEIPMVWCPPGTFMMGSLETEKQREDNETQHEVTLMQGFWLAQTEVTQAQWQAVMDDNPSSFKGDDLPVDTVSWQNAQEFITKLNQKLGKQVYRLPTEAEWEYACRADTTTPFHTGENLTTAQANYNGNHPYANYSKGIYREKTTPVKTFSANAWGLYDMHGNVWEWCQDWYANYELNFQQDPKGPGVGNARVLRGGAWNSNGASCSSACRGSREPDMAAGDTGFRLAQDHM